MRIGIIGGSSGPWLARAAIDLGYEVLAIAGNERERDANPARDCRVIDLRQRAAVVAALRGQVAFTVIGSGHLLALQIARDLDAAGEILSIDPERAMAGKNKLDFYRRMDALGVRVPEYRVLRSESIDQHPLFYPGVAKALEDDFATTRVNDPAELLALARRVEGDFIYQQFVDALEVTIPVTADGERVEALAGALDMRGITRIHNDQKINFGFNPIDERYDEIMNPTIAAAVCRLVERLTVELGLLGVPRYDLLVTDAGSIYVLEVNEVAQSIAEEGFIPWRAAGIDMAREMVLTARRIYQRRMAGASKN